MFPDAYALNFHGYVLVYDVTNTQSSEIVSIIHDKMQELMIKVPIVLIGNKVC